MKSRNKALAIALIVLAAVFYAVSYVRMQQTEDRRHIEDPNAHSSQGKAKP
jgi:hypothetical protein